jgi:hypothetical protein
MFHLLFQGAHAFRSISDVEKHVQDTYPQQIADEAVKEAREVIKVCLMSKFSIETIIQSTTTSTLGRRFHRSHIKLVLWPTLQKTLAILKVGFIERSLI